MERAELHWSEMQHIRWQCVSPSFPSCFRVIPSRRFLERWELILFESALLVRGEGANHALADVQEFVNRLGPFFSKSSRFRVKPLFFTSQWGKWDQFCISESRYWCLRRRCECARNPWSPGFKTSLSRCPWIWPDKRRKSLGQKENCDATGLGRGSGWKSQTFKLDSPSAPIYQDKT